MKTAKKPKTPKPLEAVVQKECLARLKTLGIWAWRRNIAAMQGEYKGKKRFIKAGEKGQADVWFILPRTCKRPGLHGEFEVKRAGEKPRYDQTLWLRKTNEETGASFWADNADTMERVIMAIMDGGRIVYLDGEKSYENPDKKVKGRIMGPTWEYDVEVNSNAA